MTGRKHIVKPEDQDFHPSGKGLDETACSRRAQKKKPLVHDFRTTKRINTLEEAFNRVENSQDHSQT